MIKRLTYAKDILYTINKRSTRKEKPEEEVKEAREPTSSAIVSEPVAPSYKSWELQQPKSSVPQLQYITNQTATVTRWISDKSKLLTEFQS